MKASRFFPASLTVAAALLTIVSVTCVMGADKATSTKPAAGNSVPATVHGQPSVFGLAGTTKEPIKDPFFPKSTRLVPVIATNAMPVLVSAAEFAVKGLSGGEGQRLALINNRNFAEGESDEVTTPAGAKRRVQVLKIKDFSVVIKAEGIADPFEIFLPKDLR